MQSAWVILRLHNSACLKNTAHLGAIPNGCKTSTKENTFPVAVSRTFPHTLNHKKRTHANTMTARTLHVKATRSSHDGFWICKVSEVWLFVWSRLHEQAPVWKLIKHQHPRLGKHHWPQLRYFPLQQARQGSGIVSACMNMSCHGRMKPDTAYALTECGHFWNCPSQGDHAE